MKRYDLIVIGAGPAGCLLYDRKEYRKPAGIIESVPGECGLCRCTYGTDQETDAPKYEK